MMGDDDYVEGDINMIDGDGLDDDSELDEGNLAGDSMPEAVLTYVARSLARDPESVLVEADERGNQVKLRLHVGPDDMGRVIGRRGRTAQAIRTLVGVAGARQGVSTNVDIVDD